ncbi:hypothetical protein BDW75DRAFT_187903 [Aspergillus navahoensis]
MTNQRQQHVTSQWYVQFFSSTQLLSPDPVSLSAARGLAELPWTCVNFAKALIHCFGNRYNDNLGTYNGSYNSLNGRARCFFYPKPITAQVLLLRVFYTWQQCILFVEVRREMSEIPNVRTDSDAWLAAEEHRSSHRQTSRASGGFGLQVPEVRWGCSAQGFY